MIPAPVTWKMKVCNKTSCICGPLLFWKTRKVQHSCNSVYWLQDSSHERNSEKTGNVKLWTSFELVKKKNITITHKLLLSRIWFYTTVQATLHEILYVFESWSCTLHLDTHVCLTPPQTALLMTLQPTDSIWEHSSGALKLGDSAFSNVFTQISFNLPKYLPSPH